jgi:hypothetical protein
MKKTKGGYAVKNGYYIKDDCKNNEADGSLDEDGYILDPLTYERIIEDNIVQLSDGLCYNKSKNLVKNIRKRNSLPFGHPLTIMDEAKFSTITASPISSIPISSPEMIEDILPLSSIEDISSEEEILIIPERRPVTLNVVPRTSTRYRPRTLIIESSSTPNNSRIVSTEAQASPLEEIVIQPRRRGRPPGSRNRNTRGNTGRGYKYSKKHKTKRQKKH